MLNSEVIRENKQRLEEIQGGSGIYQLLLWTRIVADTSSIAATSIADCKAAIEAAGSFVVDAPPLAALDDDALPGDAPERRLGMVWSSND